MDDMNVWQALEFASLDCNQGALITVNGRSARVVGGTFRYQSTETEESYARPKDGRSYIRSNNNAGGATRSIV